VSPKRVYIIIRTPGLVEALNAPSEILCEMAECQDVTLNKASIESFFHQSFQIAQSEHRNCALPSEPDKILCLRLHLHEGVPEDTARQYPIEFSGSVGDSYRTAQTLPSIGLGCAY
jgi:hypothetical protein